jgi:alkyl sulfatase BDS1-like metallo-beta-lactamase superfamily hydrolase
MPTSRLGLVLALLALCAGAVAQPASAPDPAAQPKPASAATRAANAAVLAALPFANQQDFEDARRGFVAAPDSLRIPGGRTGVAWDLDSYRAFIQPGAPAPDTVNPSLWRNAQLNMLHGLFKVADRIWQVRGYDISNITFIAGDTGWIVFDPLTGGENARAALELVTRNLGRRPVVAVVYSRSHGDHYGGAPGVISRADAGSGKVAVIAPEGFLEHALSENVIAGNAMSRRAMYMYGMLLPRGPRGSVGSGLGVTTSGGQLGLIAPNRLIARTGEELVIDGVRMVFQLTPGTEAPAEMNTYFPQFRALWMAENATHTMHNVLTLRGAQVRDALRWSHYLDEAISLWGAVSDVVFQSHHWPVWDQPRVVQHLERQRDLYKYIHDQSVNLMNKGLTGPEIAESITLPPELANHWANRGYYGTLKHNSRAVYQRYMGWYDGNPSSLDDLPPRDAARKYVAYMGGGAAILPRARADFDRGEYRWVATALRHLVFAEPLNREARLLLADAYEQLGYQAEAGTWRNVYLQGAFELRNGLPRGPSLSSASPDTVRAMPPEAVFDYLAVRLNGSRAAGERIAINFDFSDSGQAIGVTIANGVLRHGARLASADATVTLTRPALAALQLRELSPQEAAQRGELRVDGDRSALARLLALMDDFPFWFPIAAPD